MPSIADKRYFSREHIEKCAFNTSSFLTEQAVHCLELVAELVECGLSYQFKGGNSLLLVLDEPKRFSIDVDIATDFSKEKIEEVLDALVQKYGVFTRWERRQHKTKPWLPLSSYHLYFNSLFEEGDDVSVMLDVQMRRSPYKTEFKKVTCGDVYKSDTLVELPLPSSIISDKLLTLGPSTLGIPTGKGKHAQRLKHVFDVSRLLRLKPDIAAVRESFKACLEQENDLQNTRYTVAEIVQDTLAFCWSVALHNEKPISSNSVVLDENANGLIPFSLHLFDRGYEWENLQADMARAALCISAVGNEEVTNEMLYGCLEFAVDMSKRDYPFSIINSEVCHYWGTVYSWWKEEMFWVEA